MLWNPSLETGISTVDQQHKEIFKRIDMLLDINNENRFNEMLNFLGEYIVKHFTDEQQLHIQSNYPKATIHRSYHDNYVHVFQNLKARAVKESDILTFRLDVNKQVIGWLRDHILVHDMEFSKYYQELSS